MGLYPEPILFRIIAVFLEYLENVSNRRDAYSVVGLSVGMRIEWCHRRYSSVLGSLKFSGFMDFRTAGFFRIFAIRRI
jgi:hypothetical protein